MAGKKKAIFEGLDLLEPRNEAELFGLFMQVYAKRPEAFDFIPLDYSTTRGIDMIAQVKSANTVTESEYAYIELKYFLTADLNHGFRFLGYILCWDFDRQIVFDETKFGAVGETEERFLKRTENTSNFHLYYLDSPRLSRKIPVIRLREYLSERLDIIFA